MPALPLDDAGPYVAAAYVIFLALVLSYVAIMARKLRRVEQQLDELQELAEQRRPGGAEPTEPLSAVAEPTASNGREHS